MDVFTPELISTLLQVGGTPAALGLMLYYVWNTGPKQDLHRMADTVESIRADLNTHREAVLKEQMEHRDRLQRLEILAEAAAKYARNNGG